MSRLPVLLLALVVSGPVVAQRNTTLYAEALGPSASVALGAEHVVYRTGSTRVYVRAGASYSQEPSVGVNPSPGELVAFPVGAMIHVPIEGSRLSVEAEGGVTAVRWWGTVTRFDTFPGETFKFLPHATGTLRVDVSRRLFFRAGMTLGGVRDRGEVAPVFGVGFGL